MTSDHPYTSFSDPVDVSSSDAESFDKDDMYGSDHNMREVVMESSDEEQVGVTMLGRQNGKCLGISSMTKDLTNNLCLMILHYV